MPHKQVPLLCKIYIYNHKEALVSPAEKIIPFVVNNYHFVPRKICCASQRRCHVATLCDSLVHVHVHVHAPEGIQVTCYLSMTPPRSHGLVWCVMAAMMPHKQLQYGKQSEARLNYLILL